MFTNHEKVWESSYHHGVSMPMVWFHHYARLLRSAEVLKQDAIAGRKHKVKPGVPILPGSNDYNESMRRESFYPACMLLGFAIENLFKGVYAGHLIKREKIRSEDELLKRLPNQLEGHKLSTLAKEKVGLTLSAKEEHFLKALSHAVRWWGRYAAPLKLVEEKEFREAGYINTLNEIIFLNENSFGPEYQELLDKSEGWCNEYRTLTL